MDIFSQQKTVFWLAETLPFFALLLLFIAACTDIKDRRISNWITLSLIISFCLFATLGVRELALVHHLAWGAIALVALLPIFTLGKIGGGDVKLLVAVLIWSGPISGLQVMFLTALLGGGLALITLSPMVKFLWDWLRMKFGVLEEIVTFPTARSIPYGVVISLAGGFAITRNFVL